MRSRETIIFFLPLDIEAISSSYRAYSADGKQQDNDSSETGGSWNARQLYINPQTFSVREQKLIQKSLTKGGYVVQYWGEELPTIQVNGTTGSAGVEGINILRDIYRHEQIHYRTILAERQRRLAEAAAEAAREAEEKMYEDNAGGFFKAAGDALTGGAVTSAIDGISNGIDILFGSDTGSNFGGKAGTFASVPTLASFAVNIDMYYQGRFYRGYFNSFSSSENATEPGHFNYDFSFTVTRRTGERKNFMPWHRNPLDFDGTTRISQKTTDSKGSYPGSEWLSFPPKKDLVPMQQSTTNPKPGVVESEFTGGQDGVADDVGVAPNAQPFPRNKSLK